MRLNELAATYCALGEAAQALQMQQRTSRPHRMGERVIDGMTDSWPVTDSLRLAILSHGPVQYRLWPPPSIPLQGCQLAVAADGLIGRLVSLRLQSHAKCQGHYASLCGIRSAISP
jgi:hypothetical protein